MKKIINSEIRDQIKSQTSGYMMAAFGLVAGLAWNDAIKGLIEILFPFAKGGILAKFIYAVIITLVVILIGRYLLKPVSSVKK
ncbi:MAG: DUF5654 family protein [Patescibacteria group bacterium]